MKIVLVLLLTNRYSNIFSQVDVATRLINNDSLQYSIAHKTQSTLKNKNDELVGYYVRIALDKKTKDTLLIKTFDFWKMYLNNPVSDWAANLLLHCLYNREASSIVAIENNRSIWMKVKGNEIKYWEDFFRIKIRQNN